MEETEPQPFDETSDDETSHGETPEHDPLIGQVIGDCRVVSRIGGGGMGEVYLAEQTVGSGVRQVALKTIIPAKVTKAFIRRFKEEAAAAGTLNTPYVIKVYQSGEVLLPTGEPLHYLVMEFANAGDLADYLHEFENGRLPIDEAMRLLRQAAEGLLAAERYVQVDGKPAPIYHRDIKPANLLLTRRQGRGGTVLDLRVADFGSAKRLESDHVTQEGSPMTPGYASPEQWLWDPVDHQSDMYSLGATFYHVLTGARAAPESNQLGDLRREMLRRSCLDPRSVRDDVPNGLNRVVKRMTALKKEDRYASFADVVDDLAALEQEPSSKLMVRIAVAVILLTGTLVGLEIANVTDFLPQETVDKADTVAERQKALAQVRAAIVAALDEPSSKPEWTGAMRRRLDALRTRILETERELGVLVIEKGPEYPLDVTMIRKLEEFEAEQKSHVRLFAKSKDVAGLVSDLLESHQSYSSRVAREKLGDATDKDAFTACPKLKSVCDDLRQLIETEATARASRVTKLERRYRTVPLDLAVLRAATLSVQDDMGALDERELLERGDALLARIDAAKGTAQEIAKLKGSLGEISKAAAEGLLKALREAAGECLLLTGECARVARRIDEVSKERRDRLDQLAKAFVDARTADLLRQVATAVAAYRDELKEWGEEGLEQRLARVAADVEGAVAVERALPVWPPSGASVAEAVERLEAASNQLARLGDQVGSTAEAASWWAWRQGTLWDEWAASFSALPAEDLAVVGSELLDRAEQLAKQVSESGWEDAGYRISSQVELARNKVPVDPKPDGWSDEAWQLWPKRYEVPPGLEVRRTGGQLECWFPRRVLARGGSPVPMVLVHRGGLPPFLVDVHEVVLEELRYLSIRDRRDNRFRGYFSSNPKSLKDMPAGTLAFLTSINLAREATAKAYQDADLVFDLPSRAQWSLLEAAAPRRQAAVGETPPRVADSPWDRSSDGVTGLRSGLAEWTAEGEQVGPSAYRGPREKAGVYYHANGFRCVFNPREVQ